MGNKPVEPDFFDIQLEMRMASKQVKRESIRTAKSEKAERKKVADVSLLINSIGNS